MKTHYKLAMALVAGIGLGAIGVQSLFAQTKPKAYVITEIEVVDASALAAFSPLINAAQKAAGGQPFRTAGGKIVALDGTAPPKRVAITEWNSLEQAEAFRKSAAWKDLSPQRDKAIKIIRSYAVEAAAN